MSGELHIVIAKSNPEEVLTVVSDVQKAIIACTDELDKAHEFVKVFQDHTAVCMMIVRNLNTLYEILTIITFLSETLEALMAELDESLHLCLSFLEQYGDGSEHADMQQDEVDDIANKLAFMNKLLHLNQHSFSIRLLMEQEAHAQARPEFERKRDELGVAHDFHIMPMNFDVLEEDKVDESSTENSESGSEERTVMSHKPSPAQTRFRAPSLTRGKSRRPELAFGPINAPAWFDRPTRELEWSRLNELLVAEKLAVPVVVFITGAPGSGKSAFARLVCQRLHHYLDYHCVLNCRSPNAQFDEDFAPSARVQTFPTYPHISAETLMRSVIAPEDAEDLTWLEVQRVFRHLTWHRRGVLLLLNAVSDQQVKDLLPKRGKCVVVVTSTQPLQEAMQEQPGVRKFHMRLKPLELSASLHILSPPELESKPRQEDVDKLQFVCSGSPLHMEVAKRVYGLAELPLVALIKFIDEQPGDVEQKFFSRNPERDISDKKRVLYFAFKSLTRPAKKVFAGLHVFPSTFSFQAMTVVLDIPESVAKDAMMFLLALGLVQEVERGTTSRRRAQMNRSLDYERERYTTGSGSAKNSAELFAPQSRYVVHPTLRSMARLAYIHLTEDCDEDGAGFKLAPPKELWQRFAAYYVTQLELIDDLTQQFKTGARSRKKDGYALFDLDVHNIRAAQHLAVNGCCTPAVRAALTMPRHIYTIRFSAQRRADILSFYLRGGRDPSVKSDQESVVESFRLLGESYLAAGDEAKSTPCFKQCLSSAGRNNLPLACATAHKNIARVYERQGDFNAAIEECKKGVSVHESLGPSVAHAKLLLYTADLHKPLGEYSDSCDYSLRARAVCNALKDNGNDSLESEKLYCSSFVSFGDALCREGKFEEALDAAEKAEEIATKLRDVHVKAKALRLLEKCFDGLSKFYRGHCVREKLNKLLANASVPVL